MKKDKKARRLNEIESACLGAAIATMKPNKKYSAIRRYMLAKTEYLSALNGEAQKTAFSCAIFKVAFRENLDYPDFVKALEALEKTHGKLTRANSK